MNYQKLDASLISAMEQSEARPESKLSVFVRINPSGNAEDLASLPAAVGSRYAEGQTVVTATLEPAQIVALSESSAVTSIKLAHQLRMMPSESE